MNKPDSFRNKQNLIDFGTDSYFVTSDWHANKACATAECAEMCQLQRDLIFLEIDAKNVCIVEESVDHFEIEIQTINESEIFRCRSGGKVSWEIYQESTFSNEFMDSFMEDDLDEIDIPLSTEILP